MLTDLEALPGRETAPAAIRSMFAEAKVLTGIYDNGRKA
jgi:hypothetical protein